MDPPGRPWLILHRASANRSRLRRGQASPADYLELDVRTEAGRVALRHDRLLFARLPFLTVRHGLPRPRLRRLWLEDAPLDGGVFLDFKDSGAALVDRCVATLRVGGRLQGAIASTPAWEQLDYLARQAPEIGRYYSIGRGADASDAWHRYEERIAADRAGDGVSIHRESALPKRLADLRDRRLRAICYPVNDYEAGVALIEAGAGGLTTDRIDLIERWRARWP